MNVIAKELRRELTTRETMIIVGCVGVSSFKRNEKANFPRNELY
jgi:hypothetical protein